MMITRTHSFCAALCSLFSFCSGWSFYVSLCLLQLSSTVVPLLSTHSPQLSVQSIQSFTKSLSTWLVKVSRAVCWDVLMSRAPLGSVNKKKKTQPCSYPRTLSSGCYVNHLGLINTTHIISKMEIQMPACVNYCCRSHLHFCGEMVTVCRR